MAPARRHEPAGAAPTPPKPEESYALPTATRSGRA